MSSFASNEATKNGGLPFHSCEQPGEECEPDQVHRRHDHRRERLSGRWLERWHLAQEQTNVVIGITENRVPQYVEVRVSLIKAPDP